MAIPIDIQPATSADLDDILPIEEESFDQPWRRSFFESELDLEGRHCLVARTSGSLAGYLFAMVIVDEMHINKIAVGRQYRRAGVANALMDRCVEIARANVVRALILEVRQSNAGARDFYLQRGFNVSYMRPRYYPDGEAAVVMVKEVGG
jgi:ribosomal-protein-alanine N-acetyltransferase